MEKKVVTIGIAGGSASGKTSIAKKLKQSFQSASFQIIRMDDYYKDQSDLSLEDRKKTNYDHPFAFDIDLFVEHIHCLKQHQSIDKPQYDYVLHNRKLERVRIDPTDVIIIEGSFCLENQHIRSLLDMKLFVDTPADVRFIRRLVRDVNERGRSLKLVINQYMNTVRIMHDLFVEPSKKYADLIIPEGSHNKVALDLLMTKISSILVEDVL